MLGDSFRYLGNIGKYDPGGIHPIGYGLFVLTPAIAVGGLKRLRRFSTLRAWARRSRCTPCRCGLG